ncbi:MAG: hypothetical protein IPM48_10395 [Saprospiraceae bacterium]|nr:hypothetical protein [Saprospiraceae bacterium]
MIQLIADAGSTKTHWALSQNGQILQEWTTAGLNPMTQSKHSILSGLQSAFSQINRASPDQIWYYGAGCIGQGAYQMTTFLRDQWPECSHLNVHSDLLGAARAVCNKKPGVVAILGTGSNSALSDGRVLIHQLPALGYLLGDEGSASHICKQLLVSHYYQTLDPELSQQLTERMPVPSGDYLAYLYSSPRIAYELASLFPFVLEKMQHPDISRMVDFSLDLFFKNRIAPYSKHRKLPLHFAGSVSIELKENILKIAETYEFQELSFSQQILHKLCHYHHETD